MVIRYAVRRDVAGNHVVSVQRTLSSFGGIASGQSAFAAGRLGDFVATALDLIYGKIDSELGISVQRSLRALSRFIATSATLALLVGGRTVHHRIPSHIPGTRIPDSSRWRQINVSRLSQWTTTLRQLRPNQRRRGDGRAPGHRARAGDEMMMTALFRNDAGPGRDRPRRAADGRKPSLPLVTCVISHGWNTWQSEKQKR